ESRDNIHGLCMMPISLAFPFSLSRRRVPACGTFRVKAARTSSARSVPVRLAMAMLIAALCPTAGADTVRAGRWQMDFTGPKGVQLAFDGVPVIRKSTLYVVAPGWTKVLYDQSAIKHQIQTRADGDAQVVTIDGANELFSAHYEVTLRPDDTATVALTYQLLQDAPAEFE